MDLLLSLRKVFFLFLLTLLSFSPNASFASIETGLLWLTQQQQVDGRYQSSYSLATDSQSTVESLVTLKQYGVLESADRDRAIAFLRTQEKHDLEGNILALRINKAFNESLPFTPLGEFLGSAGGFADYPAFSESVYTTAQLLLYVDSVQEMYNWQASKAVAYLIAAKKSDTSWAEEGNKSSLWVSAHVHRALHKQRANFNVSNTLSVSTRAFGNSQSTVGGWGSVLDTAQVLLAIIPTAQTPSAYKKAVTFLLNKQLENGSWNNDAYTTALVLQALYLTRNDPSVESEHLGGISAIVKSQITGQPIANASVTYFDGAVKTVKTDPEGHFSLLNLEPREYTLTIAANGYSQTQVRINLPEPSFLEIGDIKLSPSPNAGLIRGQVTSMATMMPLANVDIVIIGPQKYLTTTDENGFYSQEVEPGSYRIGFSAEGYHSSIKNLSVSKASEQAFSPVLTPLSTNVSNESRLTGTVVDPSTSYLWWIHGNIWKMRGIEGVVVTNLITGESSVTNVNGNFSIPLTRGLIQVSFEKEGFQPLILNGVYDGHDEYKVVEAGSIELKPIYGKIFGSVIDAKTGESIPFASLVVEKAMTVANKEGYFEVNNLGQSPLPIVVSAPGYETTYQLVNASSNELTRIDFKLRKLNPALSQPCIQDYCGNPSDPNPGGGDSGGGFDTKFRQLTINSFEISNTLIAAYEDASMEFSIENTGDVEEEVYATIDVIDGSNQVIAELKTALVGDGSNPILAPEEYRAFHLTWNSSIAEPGSYLLSLKVFSKDTGRMMDARDQAIEVTASQSMEWIRLFSSPKSVIQGETQSINVTAQIKNKSNTSYTSLLQVTITDPQGVELSNELKELRVTPIDALTTFDLGSYALDFGSSGIYSIKVSVVEGVMPAKITSAEVLSIPDEPVPNIRIDIEQGLVQDKVILEGNSRMQVKIRIEGTEAE